ncbi:MAG: hypothetical protein K2J67_06090 [Lachnospiraceae bacterium]|nr:hypothetical protein [Lachnospiraceae bacterium]
MGVLLCADEANEINKAVNDEIDPNLFIFCNYEPTPSVITKDLGGLFLLEICNFYKFFKDSGWVTMKFDYIYSGKDWIDYSTLPFSQKDINNINNEIINKLRTGFCHNISYNNGDASVINFIKEWFSKHNLSDSIEEIDNKAKTVIDVCKSFINCINSMPDTEREAAIGRWKEVIIEHYKNKTDIMFNIIGSYYLSKNALPFPSQKFRKNVINEIIISYFTYDFEQLYKKIEELPLKDPKKLNPILNLINDTKKKRAYGLFNVDDPNLLYPNTDQEKEKLINLFFEKELDNAINEVLKRKPDCSLLPQDILNEVFSATTVFNNLNIPCNRFDFSPR